MIKKLILLISNLWYELRYEINIFPVVMSVIDTLKYVAEQQISVCRFGDGEFRLCCGDGIPSQKYDPVLSRRLTEVLRGRERNCCVCIPGVFGSLSQYTNIEKWFWREYMMNSRKMIVRLLSRSCLYGDAFISRCYLRYVNSDTSRMAFALWKSIFSGKNIVVVEGVGTNLGIGNDLFKGANQVVRILCPACNAFDYYDDILSAVYRVSHKEDLICISLGATATILAFDLAKKGYWAIDTGNLNVEYDWMCSGATEKTKPSRDVDHSSLDASVVEKIGVFK